MAVSEREDYWQDKKTEIRDKESRLKRGLEDYSEKIDLIDTKEKTLESKQRQATELEKQLKKKIKEYGERLRELSKIIEQFNIEKDDFDLLIMQSQDEGRDKIKEIERLKACIQRETKKQDEFLDT